MIEAAVDRGIREMQEDPKRSVRKLADLGRQFSRGRFQKNFFDLSQTLLQDDNSPYYTILSRLTRETNHETLKKFGVNIGYTSWTYGASLIRSYEKEHGYDVPWTVFMHYLPDGPLGLKQIGGLIEEGRSIGIYTYFIYLEEMPEDWTGLTELFHSFDNSAFLLFLPDRELEDGDADLLSGCRNLLVSAEIASCYRENIRLLKQRGCIVANHYYYYSSDPEEITRQVKDCDSPLLLFIARDDCMPEDRRRVADAVYDIRYHPEFPVFPVELHSDFRRVDQIISGRTCLLEVEANGKVSLPDGSFLSALDPDMTLAGLLRKISGQPICGEYA